MPVIPVFRRLEQEDGEYKTSLDQMVRPYLNEENERQKEWQRLTSWHQEPIVLYTYPMLVILATLR